MQVRNSQGTALELGEMIKSGGEAKIYLVKSHPNLVAKIYHAKKVKKAQRGKLKAMLAKVPIQPLTHTALAWPTELLYWQGRLAGFLMPKIDGYDSIFNFYHPLRRKKQVPAFHLRYLHRTARNLAIVIEMVHLTGHLIGDLNESNVLVNDQALVTLVDTDSFQIAGRKGQIYRCMVGKPEYTPPELQGISFQEVNRQAEHDHFALAVLIFQLLMQGYHPFYGVLPDHVSVERSDVMGIKEGLFPYYQNHSYNQEISIKKPPHAPSFAHLHPGVQALFIRCFVDGHQTPTARPTAGEWQVQLKKAEEALVTCEHDHRYSNHLVSCPFCPRELAIQKPLPSALEKTLSNPSNRLPQSLSSPAPSSVLSPATWMQSLKSLLPNGSRSVAKLLWNTILITTVAVTWLRVSGLGMSLDSPAIVSSPVSIAVVEDTKIVATHAKTTSPQPRASETVAVLATREKTATRESILAGKMACFGTFGFGITCLDDVRGTPAQPRWISFSKDNSSLGSNLISDIAICPDNRLLVAHTSGLSAFDGQIWAEYGGVWGYSSSNAIACDANGGIWVAHYEGVSYFDGQSWTTTSSKQLATGEDANDIVEDVVIAPDGKVWVTTVHTIAATLDGKTWTVYQQGEGFDEQYFLKDLAIDHLGEVWAATSRSLLHFDGGEWAKHQYVDLISPQTIAVDREGNVWVGTISDGLKWFNGQYWVTYDTQNSDLISNHINSLAVDAQDRIWASTDWGISVFDGKTWVTYQMNNADLVDNNIRSLAIMGDGPALPKASDKENGQLSGQLLKHNKEPIVNAIVELCAPRLSSRFSNSPCEKQPLILQTTTDADGAFSIPDIPAGRVVVTINRGEGEWMQLGKDIAFDEKYILINAGEESDLSILIID